MYNVIIDMRSIFFVFGLVVMAISISQDSNLFSDNGLEADLNISDDLFANEFGFNSLNDFSLNVDGSYPDKQIWDDLITDSDLRADKDFVCSSSFLSSRRIRARLDSCAQSPEKAPHYLEVKTAEDVKKYWCSQTNVLGIANIPVCSLFPDLVGVTPSENTRWHDIEFPSTPSGFVTLLQCRLSKFLSRAKTVPMFKFYDSAEDDKKLENPETMIILRRSIC